MESIRNHNNTQVFHNFKPLSPFLKSIYFNLTFTQFIFVLAVSTII